MNHAVEELAFVARTLPVDVREGAFVGGMAIPVWFDDPLSPPGRPTGDSDVVVDVATRHELASVDASMRAAGYREDSESAVICRWRHDYLGLVVDVMPVGVDVFGFSNPWYASALKHKVELSASDGTSIFVADAAHLLATKIVAWRDRGKGDLLASHDVEDLMLLTVNRVDVVADVAGAPKELRAFIAAGVAELLGISGAAWTLASHLGSAQADEARGRDVGLPRLRAIAAM